MPDDKPNLEAIAAATPPFAPQPQPQPLPSIYEGLRVRLAPAIEATKYATGLGHLGRDVALASAVGQEVKETATDPQKRIDFLTGMYSTGGEGEGLEEGASALEGEAKKLYEGLRVRKADTATAADVPVEAPKPDAANLAKQAGVVYKGELTKGSDVHMFEHPNHPGQTAAMFGKELSTPEALKSRVDAKVEQFKTKAAGGGKELSENDIVPDDVMAVLDKGFRNYTGVELPEDFYKGHTGITLGKLLDGFANLGGTDEIIKESGIGLRKTGYSKIGDYLITEEGVKHSPKAAKGATHEVINAFGESPAKGKMYYHGTRGDVQNIGQLDSTSHGRAGLSGVGTYVTDKPEVASSSGYGGKRGGRVLGARLDPKANILDAEKPLSPELHEKMMGKVNALAKSLYPDENPDAVIGEHFNLPGKSKTSSYMDIMDGAKRMLFQYNDDVGGLPAYEGNERLMEIQDSLAESGIHGVKYAGGKRVGGLGEHEAVMIFPGKESEVLTPEVPAKEPGIAREGGKALGGRK